MYSGSVPACSHISLKSLLCILNQLFACDCVIDWFWSDALPKLNTSLNAFLITSMYNNSVGVFFLILDILSSGCIPIL